MNEERARVYRSVVGFYEHKLPLGPLIWHRRHGYTRRNSLLVPYHIDALIATLCSCMQDGRESSYQRQLRREQLKPATKRR